MPVIAEPDLRHMLTSIVRASGTPDDIAQLVGDSLVDANLAGHDSHGAIRIVQYLDQVENGSLDPAARPEVMKRSNALGMIDGYWGWGQPAMQLATEEAIRLAGEYGVGFTSVVRCFHIGRVAPYVERIAAAGMVGVAMAHAGPAVAPYGGKSRVMGTNPMAWAVPRAGDSAPVSFDVATAFIAEGKLRVARDKGVPVPQGAVVSQNGVPSVDPSDFYNGGSLMTFGGHKGSGLSILAQLLGRGLTGLSPEENAAHRGSNGPVVLAVDVGMLVPADDFLATVEEQVADIVGCEPAEGFDRVKLPGEPQLLERERRQRSGIEIPERTWTDLMGVAQRYGVDLGVLGTESVGSQGPPGPM